MLKKIKTYLGVKKKINFLSLSREEIEKIQLMKLRNLISHAYNTVPYYNDLFKSHNLAPADIRTLDDLRKVPISSKKDFVNLDKVYITSNLFSKNELYLTKSSGSTGEPFFFYLDKNYKNTVKIDNYRSEMIHGLRLKYRILKLGGDLNITKPPKNSFDRLFLRRVVLSSFCPPESILKFYRKFKPNVIRGYISSIYAFALWLEENNIDLKPKPEFVLCSAEMAHDFMVRKVSEILKTRVIDRYATVELGIVADQCEDKGGYHVFEDSVFPELIKMDGKNYFIGTNLDNYATPFIRYNTFDICEANSKHGINCSCGANTKKIEKIFGRDNDYIKTPKGNLLSPIDLIFLTRRIYNFVKKFRFIQENIESLKLEIVLRKKMGEENLEGLIREFEFMSTGLRLEIQEVEDIEKDRSGKMRIICSNV